MFQDLKISKNTKISDKRLIRANDRSMVNRTMANSELFKGHVRWTPVLSLDYYPKQF